MIKQMLHRYERVIRYLIVGGLTTFVSLACYFFCVSTFLDPENPIQLQAANIISWVAAVTFAYAANRRHVFRSQNSNVLKEAFAFYCSRVGTLAVEMILMLILVSLLKMNDKIAKFITQFFVMALNYIVSRFFVFKPQK